MKPNKQRMQNLSASALPPKGTLEYKIITEELKRHQTPEILREIKKRYFKATSLIEVQQLTGLGFKADEMLREYNREYNGRVLNGSLHDLPGSFNVAEAFNEYSHTSGTFVLREELDHIFSFDDFIDFVTSDSVDATAMPSMEGVVDGIIYSYNSTTRPDDTLLYTCNGKNFGFSAVSFIKFKSEISIMVVAGQDCDLSVKNEEILDVINSTTIFDHRANIKPAPELKVEAKTLDENSSLLKTIVLTRIDLENLTFDVRYVYEDWGDRYTGLTDDVTAFLDRNNEFINDVIAQKFKEIADKVNEYSALFELCKTCLFLPKYFDSFADDIRLERHPTEFLNFRSSLKNKKAINAVDPVYKVAYRQATALIRAPKSSSSSVHFLTPSLRIENTGYWKMLEIGAQGQDKNGNAITGRTWVSKTLTWVEKPVVESQLSIFKSLGINRESRDGLIYVMRSAAHPKEVFKVGLTSRSSDTRAAELSSSTSSLDHFLVIEEWPVKDCVLAEKLIHKKLEAYRLNPKREFFKAKYSKIHAVIEEVVNEINTNRSQ